MKRAAELIRRAVSELSGPAAQYYESHDWESIKRELSEKSFTEEGFREVMLDAWPVAGQSLPEFEEQFEELFHYVRDQHGLELEFDEGGEEIFAIEYEGVS